MLASTSSSASRRSGLLLTRGVYEPRNGIPAAPSSHFPVLGFSLRRCWTAAHITPLVGARVGRRVRVLNTWNDGLDVIVEGDTERVTGRRKADRAGRRYSREVPRRLGFHARRRRVRSHRRCGRQSHRPHVPRAAGQGAGVREVTARPDDVPLLRRASDLSAASASARSAGREGAPRHWSSSRTAHGRLACRPSAQAEADDLGVASCAEVAVCVAHRWFGVTVAAGRSSVDLAVISAHRRSPPGRRPLGRSSTSAAQLRR